MRSSTSKLWIRNSRTHSPYGNWNAQDQVKRDYWAIFNQIQAGR